MAHPRIPHVGRTPPPPRGFCNPVVNLQTNMAPPLELFHGTADNRTVMVRNSRSKAENVTDNNP